MLHESVVIVTVQTLNVPHVDEDERVTIDDLGYSDDGITHVTARFGFQDDLDVPARCAGRRKRLEGDVDFEGGLLLPLPHLDHRHRRARDGAVAQEAVHRDRPQRGQPRALLPPPRRPHVVMAAHIEL